MSPTRIVTYWIGYPLVLIGGVALIFAVVMDATPQNIEAITSLMLIGLIFSMSGAACFFHALMVARKIGSETKGVTMIRSKAALERAHAAAKMIEVDGIEGYHSCCQRFGEDVANALVVMFLRRSYTPSQDLRTSELAIEQTNNALEQYGAFAPELVEERKQG